MVIADPFLNRSRVVTLNTGAAGVFASDVFTVGSPSLLKVLRQTVGFDTTTPKTATFAWIEEGHPEQNAEEARVPFVGPFAYFPCAGDYRVYSRVDVSPMLGGPFQFSALLREKVSVEEYQAALMGPSCEAESGTSVANIFAAQLFPSPYAESYPRFKHVSVSFTAGGIGAFFLNYATDLIIRSVAQGYAELDQRQLSKGTVMSSAPAGPINLTWYLSLY